MISFAVTVSNEEFEFFRLVDSLLENKLDSEEIVVLADAGKVTDPIREYCKSNNISFKEKLFDGNFGDFKNAIIPMCSKEYMFQIDADEEIPVELLYILRRVSEEKKISLLWISRVNIVVGRTQEDIKEFNWVENKSGWINFPDYQARFARISSNPKWQGLVHEILQVEFGEVSGITTESRNQCIGHIKNIEKQRSQNLLYKSLEK